MAGSPIEVFTDVMKTTGNSIFTSEEEVILETVRNTYVLPRFMVGKNMSDMLQGGAKIQDTILFDESTGYKHYDPNEEFSYDNPQNLTNWEVSWRFTSDYMVWTDHELGLNTGQLGKGARHHKYKTLKRTKEQNLWSGICNGMEDDLWAQPAAAMESTTGKIPYSIPTFIHEFGTGDDFMPPPLSTVMGISSLTQPKWRPQTETYAQGPQPGWDLFPAFSRMFHKLRFQKLPMRPELSEPTTAPTFIACSLNGIANYEDGLRRNQDEFVATGRQDPAFNGPMYRGIPLVYIEALDHAAVYDDGSNGFAGELDSSTDRDGGALANPASSGPRYYFINGMYMKMVWHSDRYFYKKEPFSPSGQPFTKIMVVDCWHNFIARSLRRHGLVSPSADVLL